METTIWVTLAVAVTVMLAWAYSTAQRLDRLHVRVDRARNSLEAALDRRAAVLAVAHPATAPEARRAEDAGLAPGDFATRIARERDLNARLAEIGAQESTEIADADARVMLALRFYNDAVADTRAVRLRPLVRVLRLGGTARLPEFFELTDN